MRSLKLTNRVWIAIFISLGVVTFLFLSSVFTTSSIEDKQQIGKESVSELFNNVKNLEHEVPGAKLRIVKTKTDPSFWFAIDGIDHGGVETSIWDANIFAPSETAIFKYILKDGCRQSPSPLVVDVGANIGYFTVYSASMGCRVESFEAVRKFASFFNRSLALNGWSDRSKIHVNAVDETERTVKFKIAEDAWGLSSVSPKGNYEVKTAVLDNEIREDVLLLKIDVEGVEDLVFRGMRNLLAEYDVKNLIVEIKETGDVAYKRKFINELIEDGYVAFWYAEDYYPPSDIADKEGWDDIHNLKLTRIRRLLNTEWLPREDVWFTKGSLPKVTV